MQGGGVDRVRFCVEDVSPSPQDALSIGGDHRIKGGAIVVNEVGRIKQKVEVFHSLSQEERLHAVVKLVVSQIFDLPKGEGSKSEEHPSAAERAGDPVRSSWSATKHLCKLLS